MRHAMNHGVFSTKILTFRGLVGSPGYMSPERMDLRKGCMPNSDSEKGRGLCSYAGPRIEGGKVRV
jgi:hypothetical protein